MTHAECEAKATEEYRMHQGKILLVRRLDGYTEKDDSTTLTFDPPIRVRVLTTRDEDILRWMDGWLDPVWDVEPLDPVSIRSCWIYGTSYHPDGGVEPTSDIVGIA